MLKRPSVLDMLLMCLYVFRAVGPRVCAPVDQTTNYFTPASGADIGGGKIPTFGFNELQAYANVADEHVAVTSVFRFTAHSHSRVADALYKDKQDHICAAIPLDQFAARCTMKDFKSIARIHNIHVPVRMSANKVSSLLQDHHCPSCETHVTVFVRHVVKSDSLRSKRRYDKLNTEGKMKKKEQRHASAKQSRKEKGEKTKQYPFPPPPPSMELKEVIVRNWCEDSTPDKFMEDGCAVCGQLTPLHHLKKLSEVKCDLEIRSFGGSVKEVESRREGEARDFSGKSLLCSYCRFRSCSRPRSRFCHVKKIHEERNMVVDILSRCTFLVHHIRSRRQ
jgi:hypothetical protein